MHPRALLSICDEFNAPKGEQFPAESAKRVLPDGSCTQAYKFPNLTKNFVKKKATRGRIPVFTLKRTDTTLDLSQKGREGILDVTDNFHYWYKIHLYATAKSI